ncbi:unnamed protein product [Adineta steineri]|uniref:Uncharacterized protein n=1 Tax=Adineta steineri TaxID=433720 RepID=A0A814P7V4_9BILA|nr:unnamed protein product [Adineta steineri]CAF3932107.1 unnamed protein product [Adineta steineri]
MSATDNWIKLYRWWQEHLKSHFNASSSSIVIENSHEKRRSLLQRRSSLMSFRSSNHSKLINVKKRASFGGIEHDEEISGDGTSNGGFRYVRDSIRNKNSRSTRLTTTTVTQHKRLVIENLVN